MRINQKSLVLLASVSLLLINACEKDHGKESTGKVVSDYLSLGDTNYSDRKWYKDFYSLEQFDFGGEPTDFGSLSYIKNDIKNKSPELGDNDFNYYLGNPEIQETTYFSEVFEEYHFPKEKYEFYIAKIKYNTIARAKMRETATMIFEFYPEPKAVVSYLVLMKDKNNGKYKAVDSYPDHGYPNHVVKFIRLRTAFKNNDFESTGEVKTKIERILKSFGEKT